MKTIYRTITGNFSSPRTEYFATREEAYNNVNWVYGYDVYNPVTIEMLTLTEDNKIEVYECFKDSDGVGDYENWNAEKEMFIFGEDEADQYTAKEYFLDSDDNYTLGDGEPDEIIEEGDDEYEDIRDEFDYFF